MRHNIKSIVETVLDTAQLSYENEGAVFTFSVSDDNADFPIRIIVDEEQELLLIIGYYPVKVTEQHMDRICRVVNDINYRTMVGAFVIDSADGELSFRVVQNVDDGAFSENMVRACIWQVVSRLSDCYEEVMSALFGGSRVNFTFPTERDAVRS